MSIKFFLSNKNVVTFNLDDFKSDKDLVEKIRQDYGFSKSVNAKFLLKLFSERKAPKSFRDSESIKLCINEDSGVVYLENEKGLCVVVNNQENSLIEILN